MSPRTWKWQPGSPAVDRRGSLWVAHDNSHAQQDEYLMEYVGNLDDLNVPLKD